MRSNSDRWQRNHSDAGRSKPEHKAEKAKNWKDSALLGGEASLGPKRKNFVAFCEKIGLQELHTDTAASANPYCPALRRR